MNNETKVFIPSIPVCLIWLFHVSGLIGILLGFNEWILEKTPLNLIACFVILILTWPIRRFWDAFIVHIFFAVGIFAEWLGIHYQVPFGNYYYGDTLGMKLDGVPILIGINWAMLVLVTGGIASNLIKNKWLRILLGSSLMVFLDLFIEPNAAHLDFWHWEDGIIPFSNYIGWFAVSALLHWLFQERIRESNFIICLNLYLAQLLFFICLYVSSFF